MPYTTILDAGTLRAHLTDSDWVVFDLRHDLSDPALGGNAYAAGHIPGARFLHLDRDLSAPTNGRNGRHPLPDPEAFAALLSSHGVGPSSQIVAYDANGGMFASRLWWMARWIGHEAVAVLDGGLLAWLKHGGKIDAELPPSATPGGLQAKAPLVERLVVEQVERNLESRERLVVDGRSPDRFRGENETLDPVGGHIPGAVNRFFKDNLADDGTFKAPSALRVEWGTVLEGRDPRKLILHCGSGVSACHNLLGMEIAGLGGAGLYAGSWSEWCSDPRRPVGVGNS